MNERLHTPVSSSSVASTFSTATGERYSRAPTIRTRTWLPTHGTNTRPDLGLTAGAPDDTKARYAFVYGDFRRIHRSGIIACHYRAAEWRHKEIELAAHDLLQLLDETRA
jgi:hypothetical protein